MKRFRLSGFTLIELLIVVAIIAILAAIAVPNFLEAQTRSKVSRVKADLRSISLAEEAYFVDNNSYTIDQDNDPGVRRENDSTGQPREYGFQCLTTPVAYMTSVTWLDPFSKPADLHSTGQPGDVAPIYQLSSGSDNYRRQDKTGTNSSSAGGATVPAPGQMYPRVHAYLLFSLGPDQKDQMGNDDWPYNNGLVATDGTVSGAGTTGNAGTLYDPTNGTVSLGEVQRYGGAYMTDSPYSHWTLNGLIHTLWNVSN